MAVPTCAATCLALSGAPAAAFGTRSPGQAASRSTSNRFDEALDQPLTYRQMFEAQCEEFIPLSKRLEETLGHERTVEILKAHSSDRGAKTAKAVVERLGGNAFDTVKTLFSPGNPSFGTTMVFDVVESTEKVHELRVAACLWADTWRKADAGELGFAAVCWGDYAGFRAFSPNLELVRTQTLMQGHPCCNHRMLWRT
jgi:hypothetical protein